MVGWGVTGGVGIITRAGQRTIPPGGTRAVTLRGAPAGLTTVEAGGIAAGGNLAETGTRMIPANGGGVVGVAARVVGTRANPAGAGVRMIRRVLRVGGDYLQGVQAVPAAVPLLHAAVVVVTAAGLIRNRSLPVGLGPGPEAEGLRITVSRRRRYGLPRPRQSICSSASRRCTCAGQGPWLCT